MNFIENKIIKFLLIIIIFTQLIFIGNKRLNFDFEILKKSFSKDFGGENVLPVETLEIKKIVLNKNIKKITISKYLENNVLLYQRTVEFLYPIKVVKGNDNIFYGINEKIPQECTILEKYEYLIWAKC
jgi:hypothetical protein